MRQVLGLVAAAALLASGGIHNAWASGSVENAKAPLTLTDTQLDKVTAGASTGVGSPSVGAGVAGASFDGGPWGPNGPLGPHGVLPGATH
jgi:hypothetical protein